MESPAAVPEKPRYQRCGHTPCNRDEDKQWFMVDVKVHGTTLTIHVSSDEFHNSPARLDEFTQYLEILQLDMEGAWFPDDDNDEDEEEEEEQEEEEQEEDDGQRGGESPTRSPMLDLSLDNCYEWAVGPFLPLLEELAPRQIGTTTVTLQHFFTGESFEANLRAVDDTLLPGAIQAIDDMENIVSSATFPRLTGYPIFQARKVKVLSDDPKHILTDEPTRVQVRGTQLFFFKAFQDPDDAIGAHEALTLERISQARFDDPQEVRTLRLFGTVQDTKSHIIGLLLHYIQADDTLHDKLTGPGPIPSGAREKWKRQVTGTLEALHGAGIVWGDAKAGNVLVDTAGDAWVTDFGGGRTEGWVDRDKAGTFEGDLQGLRAIVDFIDTGEDPQIMS